MCFEKTLLTSREFGILKHERITDTHTNTTQRWQVISPAGEIRLSEIQDDDYCVWHIDFTMKADSIVTIQQIPPNPSVGLSFTLKRNMPYIIKGLNSGVARRNQYNLTFLPEPHCELDLKKGDYELFGIDFKPEYLRKLSNDNAPLFSEFVTAVLEGRASSITDTSHMATPAIMDLVSELVNFRYPGKLRKLFTKSRVVDLLRLSIENMSRERQSANGLSAADVRALNGVKEYLMANLDNPGSVRDISLRTGVNEFKLKTGFRKLFGKSVIAFVHEERLSRAKMLIIKTELPIKVIAMKAGYGSITNFTTAFRKHFGYPPGTLKRDIDGDETVS